MVLRINLNVYIFPYMYFNFQNKNGSCVSETEALNKDQSKYLSVVDSTLYLTHMHWVYWQTMLILSAVLNR